MEKYKAHYSLEMLKGLFKNQDTYIVTDMAFTNAVSLGYTRVDEMLAVIEDLKSINLYKSMTMINNNKIWQDVYKITDGQGNKLYVKIQLSADKTKAILIQFKLDTGDAA